MSQIDAFFIIGAFRSGTTAMAKILNMSDNAEVLIEPMPKLSREGRDLYRGKLSNPLAILYEQREGLISQVNQSGYIYGEKNANLLPFVPYLKDRWKCKFIFCLRDGRDMVRSLMDWQKVISSEIYHREEDCKDFPPKAIEEDYWDYSLIRPNQGNDYFNEWKTMQQFDKICWYWSNYNREILSMTQELPEDSYQILTIDRSDSSQMKETFNFLGLSGYDAKACDEILNAKTNSAPARGDVGEEYPSWDRWSQTQRDLFDRIAGATMRELSYW